MIHCEKATATWYDTIAVKFANKESQNDIYMGLDHLVCYDDYCTQFNCKYYVRGIKKIPVRKEIYNYLFFSWGGNCKKKGLTFI